MNVATILFLFVAVNGTIFHHVQADNPSWSGASLRGLKDSVPITSTDEFTETQKKKLVDDLLVNLRTEDHHFVNTTVDNGGFESPTLHGRKMQTRTVQYRAVVQRFVSQGCFNIAGASVINNYFLIGCNGVLTLRQQISGSCFQSADSSEIYECSMFSSTAETRIIFSCTGSNPIALVGKPTVAYECFTSPNSLAHGVGLEYLQGGRYLNDITCEDGRFSDGACIRVSSCSTLFASPCPVLGLGTVQALQRFLPAPSTPTPPTFPSPTPPAPPSFPSPTPPIPSPTTSPTPDSCFSGVTKVNVLNKGTISMNELKLGDRVLTRSNKNKLFFTEVISFGHYDSSLKSEYLQIFAGDKVLEVSADHFVATDDGLHRAGFLRVGDNLDGHKVSKIEHVTSVGAYAPITTTGSIMVSGLLASSYISLLDHVPDGLEAAGQHAAFAALRMYCRLWECKEETYVNSISSYVSFYLGSIESVKGWSPWLQNAVFVTALPFVGWMYLLEILATNPISWAAMAFTLLCLRPTRGIGKQK